jgi:hypothetical protein
LNSLNKEALKAEIELMEKKFYGLKVKKEHDWTKIYLKPQFTETKSTIAFEISSVRREATPH